MAVEKIAFITGGNKGLGLETARQLGKLGITVVIGARDAAKGKAAVEALKAEGIKAESVRFDVTRAADYREVYDYLDKKYGRLDILINQCRRIEGEFPRRQSDEHHVCAGPA